MAAAEYDDLQRHGMTFVGFRDGLHSSSSAKMQPLLARAMAQLRLISAMPMRIAGSHMCDDEPSTLAKIIDSAINFASSTFYRVRARTHYGKTGSMANNLSEPFPLASWKFAAFI